MSERCFCGQETRTSQPKAKARAKNKAKTTAEPTKANDVQKTNSKEEPQQL